MEICGDNRFEIVAKAKADLLEGTNIETDEAEMAVIDNILFRCWQMGWLDRYDEPNGSEKPNNSTISKMEQVEPQLTPNYCGTCKHREVSCGDLPCDVCHGYSNYEPKDEPQTGKE